MEQGYDGTTEASSNEEQGIAGKGMSINSSTSNDSTSNDSTNNNNTNNYINNGSSIDNSIQEVDANAYNSEDFDDQSTMDMKNGNEGELGYGNDDDEYSQYSENPTTEDGSSITTKAPADTLNGTASEVAVATTETAAVAARAASKAEQGIVGVDGLPSVSTYADDFVNGDESTDVALTPTKPLPGSSGNRDYYPPSDQEILASPPAQSSSHGQEEGNALPTSNQHEEEIQGADLFSGNSTTVRALAETNMGGGGGLASTEGVANAPFNDVGNDDLLNIETKTCDSGGRNEASKAELDMLRSQVDTARAMLASSLDDDNEDGGNKPEKSLVELILLAETRGYKQAETNASEKSIENRSKRRSPSIISAGAIATATTEGECIARAALERRVESLERDLLRAGQERRVQSDRAASLRRKLAATVTADDRGERAGGSAGGHGRREETETADILALKSKVIQLVERLRQEKTARLKAERETQGVAEKVRVLSDHIEKLMVFLKHEATQKAKAHDQQRRLQKELELVKARGTALLRSNQAKDRVMIELREGSKILEDQLRLMDEKYMELRMKLDWTRQKAGKDVRRARAQASALRTKWALLCGEGGGGENPLLDTVQVHDVRSSSPPATTSADNITSGKSQRQHRHGGTKGWVGGGPPTTKGNDGPQAWTAVGGRAGGLGGRGGGPSGSGVRGLGSVGGLVPSRSESALSTKHHQQKRVTTRGGSIGVGNNSVGGWGATPPGEAGEFIPGLSAGSDPGGGIMGGVSGRGGGQRPPWTEQGTGGASGGGHSPLLYA